MGAVNFDLSVRLMRTTIGRPYKEKREINKSRTNKISPQTRHQILIDRGVWVEAPRKRLPPNR